MRKSLAILVLTLLSACLGRDAFGTETQAVWCRALLEDAPTASTQDTPQTQEEVADIGGTIDTLCEEVDV